MKSAKSVRTEQLNKAQNIKNVGGNKTEFGLNLNFVLVFFGFHEKMLPLVQELLSITNNILTQKS